MLKAGFSRLDVTPPFGTDISGYFYRRIADGILDPLYLNTVAVGNGIDTLILMAVDYIGITLEYSEKIRNAISEKTGIPSNHIMLAALHQHTSPCISDPKARYTVDSGFLDVFIRKCCDSAKMAIDDMSDATLGTAAAETDEPIAFVRRYFLDDGTVKTNPGGKTPRSSIVSRCAEADNTVRLLRFTREGKNDIAIVNFSTHPDVIGGTKFSADWCGFVRKYVENDLDGVSCAFFTGTQGDSNHLDFFKPKEERGRGYEHSKFMGKTVANTVVKLWNEVKPDKSDSLRAEFKIIYNVTNVDGIEKYDDCKRFKENYDAGITDPDNPITSIAYATRVIKLRTSPIFRPVPLTVFGIGDVIIVGFGGEAFTEYGKAARELAGDRFAVCSVCANGYEGYFPTEKAFAEGGYETSSSLFTPTLQKEIVTTLDEMINKI